MPFRESRVHVFSLVGQSEERYDHYRRNGGDTTINSLLGQPLDAPVDGIADAQAVRSTVPDLVAFILFAFDYETDDLFVHAVWI